MKILLNGDHRDVSEGTTLASLLTDLELPQKGVLVERNERPVDRTQFEQTPLSNGDRIELVRMVAGG
jgi:thiamine biosynthesis protein ThiS